MDGKVYFTYIVASRSHTLYVGMTGDLLKRVFEHKRKIHEGFSATYNSNRLVWFERFDGPWECDCTGKAVERLDSRKENRIRSQRLTPHGMI